MIVRPPAMAFHTLSFALFLLVTLVVTWSLARHHMLRLGILLAASYFFYMNSRMIYIFLILGSTVVDYCCGLWMVRLGTNQRKKKALLALSLLTNLGLLGTFKYYDFFLGSIQTVLVGLEWVPADAAWPFLKAMLPVGISFYTFQTMAYSIDVYRGRQEPIRNFLKFALFVSFFPQLVAGPIVLANHLVPQFENRATLTTRQVSEGIFLIMRGLIKKVLIADFLGLNLVDRVYDSPELYTSAEVLLALYAYSMQIYGDFSGYTDMAIGTGKLFGYELPKNFDRPYQAESVAKFWRRWHMTLSRWVREYIYFPLGGTKKGETRAYINIMITLVAMGLWHGANWTFVWYGVIHGAAVCLNRYHNQKRTKEGTPYVLQGWSLLWRVVLTFNFVSLARILFRSQDLGQAWAVTDQLLGTTWAFHHVHWKVFAVLFASYAIHWAPQSWVRKARDRFVDAPAILQGILLGIVLTVIVYMASVQPVPFIYFAF